jgi:predicted transcriptional regulator
MIVMKSVHFENKNTKIIFEDLAIHRVHTPEEISNELNLSISDVITSLNNLTDVGLVIPVSQSGVGSVIYSLSVEGLKLTRTQRSEEYKLI